MCCEFELKITPIKLWCVERKVVTNIKVTTNNNNNKHRCNLGIKWKTQNQRQKIKRRAKQTHQKMFTQFGPTWPTLERDWSLQSTIKEFLQRDTKKLQKFSFNKAHKEQTLISTIFPISPMNMTLNDYHSPKVYTNVSQPKRTSKKNTNQRLSTLKLPPLIS